MDTFAFDRNVCVCFTGHRLLPAGGEDSITKRLDDAVLSCLERGKKVFLSGGAVGFDTLCAYRVLAAKKKDPEVTLVLVLPCRDQTGRWKSLKSLEDYKYLKDCADAIIYTKDFYDNTCMKVRNEFMVDHSSLCIAYYSGAPGGTANTVRYAEKNGISVINVAK